MNLVNSMKLEIGSILLVACFIGNIRSYSQNLAPSNQPEAYFNGSSYLRLQTTISLKKQTALSFRTCLGGTLFSQQQKDSLIELSVNAEGVVFFAKTSGKSYNEKILGNFLDNKWHVVVLLYKLGNLSLQIDSEKRLIANSSFRNELLTSPGFNNEGSSVLLIGKHFNGCILEGPSLVFNSSIIISSLNVRFERCPILEDSNNCVLKEYDYCINEPCMRHGTCINGQNGYTCSCLPRYTGKNCEFEIGNPCEKSPPVCKNGATCNSDSSGEYSCWCPPDFTGRNCERKIKVQQQCLHNPCEHGATCYAGGGGGVECLCAPGYGGTKCELNIDECKPNPCRNGGACVDGLNNYTCDCAHTGFEGRHCELNVNECLTQGPCLNHGTCFDTYGGYLCQCASGFGGYNCQQSSNECMSQPCFNSGVCSETLDGFKCTCPPGYSGERCEAEERQALCDINNCHPYGDCVDLYGCMCKSEYPGSYPNCSVDSVCLNSPCKNGGTCIPWSGAFNCSCLPGFTGKYCQTKNDGCMSYPCLNGGTCTDTIDGFTCNCTDQWMGTFCEAPFDACEFNNPCFNNATCRTTSNKHDYTCECPSGFNGRHCENNIDDCVGVTCPSGEVCVDLINDYKCQCPPGYIGENCSIDTDPCGKEPCSHGATCKMDHNYNYFCICTAGYTGLRCEVDINECVTSPGICNKGICQNEEGGFQCYCRPGYTGERCDLDFDECLSVPCQNNATCLNKINNYECICPPGYEGKDCSVDINECEPMPCMNGSTCEDGINEFRCICQAGLTGKICDINIDDCSPPPCLHDARCIDGLNNYTCDCTDTGYTGDHCEINIDDCIGDPCKNGAQCVDDVKDYRCQCYPGYKGKNCELDINECDSNPCKFNGTCLERSDNALYHHSSTSLLNVSLPAIFSEPFDFAKAAGYECLCVKGVTGRNCEVDINECESSPCFQGACIDLIGGYSCECDEGFEGERCNIDIDECERYKPCVYGNCIDKKANYFCECEPNYGGKNCSVKLRGCDDNPCLNNGTCKPFLVNEIDHNYNCSCPNGYHGHVCEKISTMSVSARSLIMINTSREEGYDIQFRFKTTLGDGLLALGKGLTYYILELSKGRLNLHSSLLNKWEGVFIGSNLNDSNWQRVFVAINSTHLVLSANDEQTIYPITFNENYNTTYTSFPQTYIGSIPSNLKKLTHGQPFLVGCTEDVLINGEWILPKDRNPLVVLQNVDEGCVRVPQCDPNPCHSGGHCTDLWIDFRCTCGRPYLGRTCQYNYTAATFGYENITDSLVTVTVDNIARRAVRTIVDISMFIRTRQAKGQIFYLGSALGSANLMEETYIAAQLEGGELLVRIQFNGTPEAYTVSGVKLDNGHNHLIEVIRNVTLVQVKLNGTEYFRKTISATGTLDAQVLFLGGQPQQRSVRQANDNLLKSDIISATTSAAIAAPLSNIHFKGVIQDVLISNGSSTMVVEFFPLQVDTNELEIPMSFGEVRFDNTTVLKGVHSDDSCRINPCRNGTCENTWNDYRCICARGYKGKDCSDKEFCELQQCPDGSICKNLEDGYECIANATFDAKSPALQYHLVTSVNSTKTVLYDTLEITYRTRSWGTVFYAKYNYDYFAIFIYHNEVAVEWNINTVGGSKRFRKDHFEGQWLTLYIEFKNAILKGGFKDMVMDEAPNIKVINFDVEGLVRILKFGVIYVGGSDNHFAYQSVIDSADFNMTGYIPASDTTTTISITSNSLEIGDLYSSDTQLLKVDQNKTTDLFKGCINEIRIGGLLLPFFPPHLIFPKGDNYQLHSEVVPKVGCILCYNSDCFNQGMCINPHETYKCNCTDGYAADDCSIDIDECENHQCENGATCLNLIGKYECQCPLGYNGTNCESEIDECLSNPCRHGGTCQDLIGTFKCDCPQEFVGKQCEAPLLITCDNQPCKEGSTCKTGFNETTNNNFTCSCVEGMFGPLCDTAFCDIKHCENGVCNKTNVTPFCKCPLGFKGKYCEVNIDDCVSPTGGSICQHGGLCIDGINRYDCDCNGTGHLGLLCEVDINECEKITLPCGPEGSCENIPGSYKCTCEMPRKCGHFCAIDDPCKTENPCEHGTCIEQCLDKPDYVCNCHDNYTGKNCSDYKVAASQHDHVNILYIVIPIVLILTVAIAIGMAVLVNIARSKRATRGTYSPSAQEFCNPRVELDHVLKPPPEERLI